MFKIVKIFSINILIFIFGIFFIELFFGSWFKDANYSDILIPKKQTNLIDTFPYPNNNLGIYSRDKYGFRANTYDLHEVNILILGGSTTEEREVDDQNIWTKIYEKNLTNHYKVVNAGIGGQTSFGHKTMFKLWFDKLTNLKPNYIIVYLGINDALYLVESINNPDFLLDGRKINSSDRDNLVFIKKIDRITQYIKNNSVFHNIYLIVKGNILSNKYKISYNSKPSIFKPYKRKKPENINYLDKDLRTKFQKYYYKNLTDILESSKKYNSEVIFVTQKISSDHWLKKYLGEINSLTLDFCNIKKIFCININSNKLKINNKHFYDGIHTTPEGSKLIGLFIADIFNKKYFY